MRCRNLSTIEEEALIDVFPEALKHHIKKSGAS